MLSQEQRVNQGLKKLEQIIINRIQDIKVAIYDEDRWVAEEIAMKKTSNELIYPKYDKRMCYYQEFWKVYLINQIMISKIKQYSVLNKSLTIQIDELEVKYCQLKQYEKQWSQIWAQKTKTKKRRKNEEIEKAYECPFMNCDKNYGSDVALNNHMKLKHNSGTKTQRQTFARELCLAQEQNRKIEMIITFPPGYLEKFRENFRKEKRDQ